MGERQRTIIGAAQAIGGLILAFSSVGMLSQRLSATPFQSDHFASWCIHKAQLNSAQQHTLNVILDSVQTTDCQQAEQRLSQQPYLLLINQGLTDLSPIAALPHLQTLDLSKNQIVDLSPLQHLKQLRFVHLQENRIQTVHPLANLEQPKILNFLSNPVSEKVCPVKPTTVCLFSDGATDLSAQAEDYFQAGKFQADFPIFEQALDIYQRHRNLHRQGDILNRLADLHLKLGQYPQALAQNQQALKLQHEIEDAPGVGVSLMSLASTYAQLGQYAKAQQKLEDAIANIQSQDPFRLDGGGPYQHAEEEGLLYHRLARFQLQQEAPTAAFSSLDKAKKLYQNLPPDYPRRFVGEHLILEAQGIGFLKQGYSANAIRSLEAALAKAQQTQNSAGVGSTLNYLGEVYLSQRDTAQAITHFTEALNLYKQSADQPGIGLTRHNLGRALLQNQQYPAATQQLLSAINVWETLRPGLVDEQKIALFETQAETYQHLQVALLAQGKQGAALEISERGRARAFIELLATRSDPTASKPPLPTTDQIQEIARNQDATLVEYSLIDDQLLIWVVAPDGQIDQRTVDLAQQSLPSLIQATQEAMGVSDRGGITVVATAAASASATQKPLRQLHQILIEPIADLLPTDPDQQVIMIPHRELFLVPFPALQSSDGPLILKHTLVSSPSIQLLAYMHEQDRKNTGENLVVGNPQMPSLPGETGQQTLIPLPGAEREAVAIATLLNTQALTGPNATETAVVEKMATADTIHLATHGLLNELSLDTPGAIALTPSPSASRSDDPFTDGFLTTAEILDLQLQANLVVLSACNTGVGKITGDGVVGLARAFMAVGTPSILVSLWSVPDAPTAELMMTFYRQQQHHPDKAKALRQAMLMTRKHHPHPKDWAAFTLMGESSIR